MSKHLKILLALGAVLTLVGAACGKDDGGEVREVESESESGSASASGTGSGSESGTGSASASGTGSGTEAAEEAECVTEDAVETPADTEVEVEFTEWAVEPAVAEVAAGAVEFKAENKGVEPHELVIVKAESVESLPVADDGSMDEEGLEAGALIGEIEPFAGGQTCEGTFALEAGSYVLLCNIVEEEENGEIEAHFKEGMFTTFTVT
ncbi:MAG: hypothetical protein HYU28_11750 [Actinobacteria bacterium]|nr:hypothetical protein [Actinomycetota bacterium]